MTLVLLEQAEGVATLTLNRPGMGNALVPELLDALLARLAQVGDDEGVRAVVLRANGPVFSLGGDMRRFHRAYAGDIAGYAAELVGKLNRAILGLIDLPQPVVAAVHGTVTGGSLGLVLASDIVFVAAQASFKAHYATAGFSPDGGWTALLPRLAGARAAAACLLLNRSFSAQEALDWGMASAVAPAELLAQQAAEAARRIARYPAGTMRNAKRLLWRDRDDIAAALEAERRGFVELIASARGGVERFLANFRDYPEGE